MPGIGFFTNLLCTFLQYAFLFLLYYFLYHIVRLMYRDLSENSSDAAAREAPSRLLVVEEGQTALAKNAFPFRLQLSLGRDGDNDVVIDNTYVSHHHALICRTEKNYVIEDLGSINHTYLNGEALREKTVLKNGDLIKIGVVIFRFER